MASFTDVPTCPVFSDLDTILGVRQYSISQTAVTALAATLACVIVVVLMAILVLAFVNRKYRIITRLKAWRDNQPYADVDGDSHNRTEGDAGHNRQVETTMDMKSTNAATTVVHLSDLTLH